MSQTTTQTVNSDSTESATFEQVATSTPTETVEAAEPAENTAVVSVDPDPPVKEEESNLVPALTAVLVALVGLVVAVKKLMARK